MGTGTWSLWLEFHTAGKTFPRHGAWPLRVLGFSIVMWKRWVWGVGLKRKEGRNKVLSLRSLPAVTYVAP